MPSLPRSTTRAKSRGQVGKSLRTRANVSDNLFLPDILLLPEYKNVYQQFLNIRNSFRVVDPEIGLTPEQYRDKLALIAFAHFWHMKPRRPLSR